MSDPIVSDKYIEDINRGLDEYEKQHAGLPPLGQMQAPSCLTMAIADLRKLGPIELTEASIELKRYSFYLQRVINKNKVWERWAKAKIDEVAATQIPNISMSYGYNERELMARHSHEVCQKLNGLLRKIRAELDRLYDLPKYVNEMSDAIRDMRFAIQRENQND